MSIDITSMDLAIEKMTADQKFALMERIWESLASKPEELEIPAWHGEVLAERRARLEAGKEEVMDIESAEEFLSQQDP